MTNSGVRRKLSAILSADVKGYSRLMAEDEAGTVETLKEYREVMASLIQAHRGRVVDDIGDNLLAEFTSVIDATQCAAAIQDELERLNAKLADHRKMEFRIGINLGDVIEDGDRIYGDGINIAARVQGLAEAGGVYISGTVYDQVRNKLRFSFDYIGEQTVKNIEEPIRVYCVIWREEEVAAKSKKNKRFAGSLFLGTSKSPFYSNVLITCVIMSLCMPLVNYFNLNLLTKIWQCGLILVPNAKKVTVVTISPDEHKKMNTERGVNKPPAYLSNPKLWRQYHPTVIKNLHQLGAEAVGFDFWFPPAYDAAAQQATSKFEKGLKWSRLKNFPVILGQTQNLQDSRIYSQADWGYLSFSRDINWIKQVMYLYSWDNMDQAGVPVEETSLFVKVLAKKLRLTAAIEGDSVRLIGKPIPRRLWLAFSETPFTTVPYHDVYNGWADPNLISGRVVLIGLAQRNVDYFQVPYSPTDFTPDDKDDPAGMPGVFLFAHAINQILNGYYYPEIHDEWSWFRGDSLFSSVNLKRLLLLLVETFAICLLLHAVQSLVRKKAGVKSACLLLGVSAAVMITLLAILPVLFGLANFVFAALIFIILFALRRPVVDGQAKSAGKRRAKAPGLRQEPTLKHREKNHEG
jgi:class 3 adenylate cyclase/CHASE2 domain-containing sensor protein